MFEPAKDLATELVALEKEMLVLLKVQRRLAASRLLTGDASTGNAVGAVRTKIVVFDPAKGANAAAAKGQLPVLSFADLAGRMTDAARPTWATLDVDGSLLLSTDTQRVQALIGGFDQPYSLEHKEHVVLVRRLEGEQTLRGWLEENPKDKTRPIAKFEVVESRGKSKVNDTRKEARQARRVSHD